MHPTTSSDQVGCVDRAPVRLGGFGELKAMSRRRRGKVRPLRVISPRATFTGSERRPVLVGRLSFVTTPKRTQQT
jgi:hypothetical protein